MVKPWEMDWSAGDPAPDASLLPIVPFFGRQPPPMLDAGGAGIDVGGVPATVNQVQAPGPSAIQAAGASPVTAADPMPMQAAGTTSAPPAYPFAVPSTLPSPALDAKILARYGQVRSAAPTADWLSQPPQPSAIDAPTTLGPLPGPAGPQGRHSVQPPVYDSWSGLTGGTAIQSSPSQIGAIPAHRMLAQAVGGNLSQATASGGRVPQQPGRFVQAPPPQNARQGPAAPIAPAAGPHAAATVRPRVRGAGRLSPAGTLARARVGAPLRDRLIAGGHSVDDATALAANAAMESGADYRSRERIRGHPNQGGRGLWMWTGPRRDLFRRTMGVSVENSTEDQQIRFQEWELAHTERRTWQHAHAAGRGAPDIAAGFATYVERPANPTRDSAERAAVAEAMGAIPVHVTGGRGSTPARRPPQLPSPRPSQPTPDRGWVFEPVHGG
ncbi:MAG: Phage tail lysozyme [Sphingomonadales bacterium]|jgi:hypothetical protein|nr:Phage tail lysozyme [Sphingomonadales bacterium]